MLEGHESRTAVIVCMYRAFAHGRTRVARFSDPTAKELLPEDARARLARLSADRTVRGRIRAGLYKGRSDMMVARTVAIDDVVREASSPQLVILGAGLDGRAWRMPELHDATVFEVDHPDSQRVKRERAASLMLAARDVRFVPVDFTRDSLDDALEAAGHDPSRSTTWIWEGVVMYLDRAAIESTLSVVSRRSHVGSRLIVAYHAPSIFLKLVGMLVARVGEPLRSSFRAEEMRDMLGAHRFDVVGDRTLPEIGATLAPDVARSTRPLRHFRIVDARRS